MSLPRFYLPQLARPASDAPSLCQVVGPEAKHASSVLRLREGDQVELFNGRGDCATAKIVSHRKDALDCECLQWNASDTVDALNITLLIALPKGDRQRVLVDAVTELGVARLVPLITQRGVAQPTDSALERLERTVIEACKQCGRNRLMEISQPQTIASLSQQSAVGQATRLVAHPYAGDYSLQPLLRPIQAHRQPVQLVIGPEGGLTDQEVASLASCGWNVVSISSTILRIEVAAIAAVSQIVGQFHLSAKLSL